MPRSHVTLDDGFQPEAVVVVNEDSEVFDPTGLVSALADIKDAVDGVTAAVLDASDAADRGTYLDVQLTNAQVLALRATPHTLVPAPGTNRAVMVDEVHMVCDAAAGAYTETADNIVVEYASGTDIVAIETTGFIDQGSVQVRNIRTDRSALTAPVANSLVRLFNNGDGEFGGGNAANTLSVRVYYHVVDTIAFS